MKHTVIGVLGTSISVVLEHANQLAGFAAGALTAAWMARQLWLSFQKKK